MGRLFNLDSPVMLLLINGELFAKCVIFWLLVGSAVTAAVNAKMLGRFFQRLVPQEQCADEK